MNASIYTLPNSRSYRFNRIQFKIELRRTVNTSPRKYDGNEDNTRHMHWTWIVVLSFGLDWMVSRILCACVRLRTYITLLPTLEFDKSQSTNMLLFIKSYAFHSPIVLMRGKFSLCYCLRTMYCVCTEIHRQRRIVENINL